MPLIVVANSPDKAAALAGLEKWKAKYAEAAALLAPEDTSEELQQLLSVMGGCREATAAAS